MHDVIERRLERLKREYAKGQEQLQELELQRQQLRETLLRISGAIQVLEELMSDIHDSEATTGSTVPAPQPSSMAEVRT